MRRIKFLLVAGAVTVSPLVLASPAMAADDIETYSDNLGDNATTYDPRGDIDYIGASYGDDGTVSVGLKTRTPVNPATDYNWIYNNTGIIWKIDVNGDTLDDYWVGFVNDGGMMAAVTPPGNVTILCNALPFYDSGTGLILATFDAACIGDPGGFRVRAYHRYGWETSVSEDLAPSDGGYCCTVFPPAPTPQPDPEPDFTTATGGSGYWMLSSGGQVFNFGDARHFGNAPLGAVDLEPIPAGGGYWVLTESGTIHSFGAARYIGGSPPLLRGEKAASLSVTPSGNGYWIFTSMGRVFAYGDAPHKGDMSGTPLNGAVLDSVATTSGQGYYMVASDGGIFNFGDARFFGSTGNMRLNKPVMSMAPDPDGAGYWLVASDGGIFAFDATFYGSMGQTRLNKPISGMVPGNAGYLMVGEDGGIFSFGDVKFHGSLGANPPPTPVVSVALLPTE